MTVKVCGIYCGR